MPVTKGSAGRNMGPTNKELRTEIQDDIIDNVTLAKVSRTADSIIKSANFHLDSKELDGVFKVEIQYQKGKKQTVAVVQVGPDASDSDLRKGLANSLKDGHTYNVT